MYLSKAELDRRNPSVRQALADANDMHRNLMRLFPDGLGASPRKQENLLYRLEETDRAVRLYLMSASKPQWAALAPRGYSCEEGNLRDLKPLETVFHNGMRLPFDLWTSPCKKKADAGKKNSVRVFLRTQEERKAWLLRQGEKGGFHVLFVSEQGERRLSASKDGGEINYHAVRFTGILQITDATAFWNCFAQGIGSGKAYGLGLLLFPPGR